MTLQVVIARRAAREIEEQYNWLAERSKAAADCWRDSLLEAINALEDRPERYPAAPEAEWREGIRELLHGRRRRVNRVLFEILGQTVVVLRVRHGAQDFLNPEEF
jgi:plasmid stabilization system protein ParE